jgi:RNA polymerase sigma factor (sigma-70 family)
MTDDWPRLDRARTGDEAAWQRLFEQYYPPLVRMALFITGSLESAKDVAQESFVSLLRANIRHRNGSLKSFLSTIAYRLALKERARRLALGKLDAVPVIDESPSVLERAVQDETDRLIIATLGGLDIEQREVLTLRFFGGHSYEEIAAITGVPVGTVKSRIFYAIKTCREKLKGEGVFQ